MEQGTVECALVVVVVMVVVVGGWRRKKMGNGDFWWWLLRKVDDPNYAKGWKNRWEGAPSLYTAESENVAACECLIFGTRPPAFV